MVQMKQLAMVVFPLGQFYLQLAELQPLLLSVLAICLSSFLLALAFFTHSRKYSSCHNPPPGSLGLPFLGETLQFAFFNNCAVGTPPPFYTTRLQRYGTNVFKSHLVGRPTVVSLDPELNKFLLINEEKLVKAYWPGPMRKILGPVSSLLGDQHRQWREIASIALSPTAIQTRYVDTIQELALSILGSWQHKMPSLDAQREIKQFVLSYDAKIYLGLEANDPIVASLLRDYNILSSANFAFPIDLPGTSMNKVMKARKRIISTLKDQVKLRKNEAGGVNELPKDCLDEILKKNDINTGKPLSEDLIAEIYFSLLLAGFDTSAALLINLLKFLSRDTHVVDELRKEHTSIQSTKRMDEKLTWNDCKKMHFTDLVVREALRLGNIAHILTRESLQDIDFKGVVIPKGWMVLMNFSMIHLNAKYYPNPKSKEAPH